MVLVIVNDAPTLTDFGPSVSFDENTVNATPQLLDGDVTFADTEGNFDGGSVSVSGLLAEDSVGIRNDGIGAGQIGVSGSDVTYAGTVIGSFAGGVGADFTVTLNGNATSPAVDALIEHLTYANSSDTPTQDRTLTLNVTDDAGADLGAAPGTASFAPLTGADNPFAGVDVGTYSTPSFVDLDGDGDMDAVFGKDNGALLSFANDGAGGFTALTGAANPFDGVDVGFASTPSSVDLDGDGDLDVVVGARDGTLRSFANDGAGGFTALTGTANPFADLDVGSFSTPSFVDLDGDGDLDAVVGDYYGTLHSFANDGVGGFTELTGAANPFDGVDVGSYSAPSFVDLDGDGDLDAVVGAQDGTLRSFANDGAGGFAALTGAANPFDGVDVGSYSAPSFVDLDGDGDLDAVVGVGNGRLFTFENTTPRGQAIAVMVNAENDAPTLADFGPSVSFDENIVNATPQLLDGDVTFADAEGNFDGGSVSVSGLLAEDSVAIRDEGTDAGEIGVSGSDVTLGGTVIGSFAGGAGNDFTATLNGNATSQAVDALIEHLTYANSSDTPTEGRTLIVNVTDDAGADLGAVPGTARFAPLTGTANPFDGIDVGKYSAPGFVDLDGDGDLDVVVGTPDGTSRSFANDGAGGFTELAGADNPFDGIDVGTYLTPNFVDLDGDGDLDAVVGTQDGTLLSFANDGAGGFTELTGAANPFDGVDIGKFSAPNFVDLDGDGDLDAVVGEYYGTLRSFANDGAGGFTELTGAANPFDGINLVYSTSPSFVDFDGDGDMDAVVGAYGGTLFTFENTTPRGQAITVTVLAQDDAGIAQADTFATDEATLVAGDLFADNGAGADSNVDSALTVAAVNGVDTNVDNQIALASGALLKVNADGTFAYDPNGAFDTLTGVTGATNSLGTDGFTYTLAGGGTATATITIAGLGNDPAYGTAGDDVMVGTSGDDRIFGYGGADTIDGGGRRRPDLHRLDAEPDHRRRRDRHVVPARGRQRDDRQCADLGDRGGPGL